MLENLKDAAVTYALENDVDDIDINANTLIDEGLFDDSHWNLVLLYRMDGISSSQ